MPDPLDGTITFTFNNTPPLKAVFHVGAQTAPFKQLRSETEITIGQGGNHFKISVNGDQITYQAIHEKVDTFGLVAPITITDKALAQKVSASIRGAFDNQGNLMRGHARFAKNMAMYLQETMVGPHGVREIDDHKISPRKEASGYNFDFAKSPFKQGQKRIHIDEDMDLNSVLISLLIETGHKIDLNAEQTPSSKLFDLFQTRPGFNKVQIEGGLNQHLMKAQNVSPNMFLPKWYDDAFAHPEGEVQAPKIAQSVRNAVKQVLADEVVTKAEATAMAKLQEKLFEFVMKFPADKPLFQADEQKLIAENEKPLIGLAEDVIAASLPPVRTPAMPQPKTKKGRH